MIPSPEQLLDLLDATNDIIGDADLVVYMTNDIDPTIDGYAQIAVACSASDGQQTKASINQWSYSTARFGAVSALYVYHSSEIGGLCLMKRPSKILQNLPYFYHKKIHVVFFHFSFQATSFSS